jgi:outer membrane protein assembly factor BamB
MRLRESAGWICGIPVQDTVVTYTFGMANPRLPHLFLCFVALAMAGPVQTEPLGELWPQWRGPERDGSVGGPVWPKSLENLTRQWRLELGPGYPGPIVAEDRVFVAETVDEETEVVRALDRETGQELWRQSWTGEGSVPFFASRNGDWIRSTPAYDGDTLFVGGMNELFFAFDADTGKGKWRIDFPERFNTDVPDFGFASSPLVDGSAIYVQAANSIVKLDKMTGRTVWQALQLSDSMFESGAFSSPVIAEIAGTRQLLVQTRVALHGIDLTSGEVLWSQEVPHFRGMNILTPVPFDGGVFTSSYRNHSYFFEVKKGAAGYDVSEAWRHKAKGYMSTPVVVGDHVYMHLSNRRFTTIDLTTGQGKWTTLPFDGQYWSMATQGDRILALDESGSLLLIEANPQEFKLIDRRQVSEQDAWAHIAVAGDQVFVREREAITVYRWGAEPQSD